MAAPLRAVGALRAATALLVGTISVGALAVSGGVSAPILVSMGTDHVLEVLNLQDEYTLVYGQDLDLSEAVIKVGNSLSSEAKSIKGDNAKISGFDKESISNKQEVTLSYLDWEKKVSVTVNPRKLETPTITFDANTGILSWEPIAFATSYKLKLTEADTDHVVTEYVSDEPRYDFNSIQFYSQFNVAVTPTSDKKGSNGVSAYLDGDPSEKMALRKMPEITNLKYDAALGKFVWDAIPDVSSYEVRVNDSTHRPTTAELPFNTTNPGVYNVSIRAIGGAGSYATPVIASFRRLPTPTLSFAEGQIKVENGERGIQYFKDGESFSGNVNDIKIPGNYAITAQNVHQSEYEIDSALSSTLTLRKLEAPTLSMVGGELIITGKPDENAVQYYLDGQAFSGNINQINDPGTHRITAKILGNANQIDSEVCGEVVVEKLEQPVISFNGEIFTFTNMGEGFTYQIDGGAPTNAGVNDEGVLSTAIINELSGGEHTIVSRNRGNGNEILASRDSNQVRFLIPDVTVNAETGTSQDSGNKYLRVLATHEMDNVNQFDARLHVQWWKNGAETPFEDIETMTITVFKASQQATPATLWFNRGQVADFIKFQVSVDIDFGTVQVLKKTFDWQTYYN